MRDRRNPGCPEPVAKPRAGIAKVCDVLDFKKIILDVVVGDGWAMGRIVRDSLIYPSSETSGIRGYVL